MSSLLDDLSQSESYCSLSTQLTMGSLLSNKYAEGFPHSRFYAGRESIDNIEECAYVQGAQDSRSKAKLFSEPAAEASGRVSDLLAAFPVYPNLGLSILTKHFAR